MRQKKNRQFIRTYNWHIQRPENLQLFQNPVYRNSQWVSVLITSDTWEPASHLQSIPSSLTVSHLQSTFTQGVNKPASVHQCNLVCSEGSLCAGQHTATGIKAHAGDIVIPVFMSLKETGCSGLAARHVCTQICVTSQEMKGDPQSCATKTVG